MTRILIFDPDKRKAGKEALDIARKIKRPVIYRSWPGLPVPHSDARNKPDPGPTAA